MTPDRLHNLSDWAAVLTFFITLIGAAVGVGGFARYLYVRHQKSKRLEEYLWKEKAKKEDHGQRSVLQIVREVGLTEDEIIQISFGNPRVGRRVKLGEDGLAKQLLFEYQDK